MTTLIVVHEIDDAEHWLASPKREELLGDLGITVRTFISSDDRSRAAVLLDVPDVAAFQALMGSAAAAEAMAHDGVRAETLEIFGEE